MPESEKESFDSLAQTQAQQSADVAMQMAKLGVETARRNQTFFDQAVLAAQAHTNALNSITARSLSNAAENDNQGAKIALDRTWNIDEQTAAVSQMLRAFERMGVSNTAISDALAAAFTKAVNPPPSDG